MPYLQHDQGIRRAHSQAGVSVLADNKTAARVGSIAEHQREAGRGRTWAAGQAEVVVPSSIGHPAPGWSFHRSAHRQATLFVFSLCVCMFE